MNVRRDILWRVYLAFFLTAVFGVMIGVYAFRIQFVEGDIFINGKKIKREVYNLDIKVFCGNFILESKTYMETLPNGVKYLASYNKEGTLKNTQKYIVPKNHYFLMGDNRDCSKDSRFLSSVGYVHKDNIVGKARFIFFSSDKNIGSIFYFWKWNKSIRFDRFFKKIN